MVDDGAARIANEFPVQCQLGRTRFFNRRYFGALPVSVQKVVGNFKATIIVRLKQLIPAVRPKF